MYKTKTTICLLFLVFSVFIFPQSFEKTTKEVVVVEKEVQKSIVKYPDYEDKVLIIGEVDASKSVTKEEFELLVRVCMSEAGGENFQGKVAVVETILNRAEMGYGSIGNVVKNAYSTRYNGEPNDGCYDAVITALKKDTFPDNMIYFRTGHYHSFGTPYQKIGNHYFSLEE